MVQAFFDNAPNLFLIKYSKSAIVLHVEVSTRNQQFFTSGKEKER